MDHNYCININYYHNYSLKTHTHKKKIEQKYLHLIDFTGKKTGHF